MWTTYFNTFKYHVSCIDGKISVRINLLSYLFFHRRPIQQLWFFPVGLSSLIQHFQQVLRVLKFLLSPGVGSWQLEFKSLIIVIVGFQNFVCCLAWAVYLGVQITDEGSSLYHHRRTKWPNIKTSPLISDLNSKINSPGQATNKISKTNNYNNSDLNSNHHLPKTEETWTPTRPVENVILTTKGLQERNTQLLDGTMVEKYIK